MGSNAEHRRLQEDLARTQNWKRWGSYLSERQWGTVREDYSPDGHCWEYFPHDHSRSRAYRWGEDGLLGICDRECRLAFALSLWNGRDPILKERLFGLTNAEGNHGEDVKECYFFLDSTPTHSYMKALYKYPQAEFPYLQLLEENAKRGKYDPEFKLINTGIFDESRYFDVLAEYAKESPDNLLIRVTIANRGPDTAELHFLPTLWFRNTWSWGLTNEGYWPEPMLEQVSDARIHANHLSLGSYVLDIESADEPPELLFTNNETNTQRLFGKPNATPYVKDAFHEYVIHGKKAAVNDQHRGTKAAAYFRLTIPAASERVFRFRLCAEAEASKEPFGNHSETVFNDRISEADLFYASRSAKLNPEERTIQRQAYAGLLWSKQFYWYSVKEWLKGDPSQPAPPKERSTGRNSDWTHVYNRDILSMPDTWEYPWYAAWDLAFHAVAFARIDPDYAKQQLLLLMREWYMHPNGHLPAYEFALSDVNPPVHAWACWHVYKLSGPKGSRDRDFLLRAFHKLLINFTWWVNRKDVRGDNLFSGGFLGLDNIGVFDRSRPLPTGGILEQSDATAWMAFYCGTMLTIALELARHDPSYEDIASKFFEHFVNVADAMNTVAGTGLWDDQDGFYYDQIHIDGNVLPLRVRSLVGLVPLLAVQVLDEPLIHSMPGFRKRMNWFLNNRKDLLGHICFADDTPDSDDGRRVVAIPTGKHLQSVLRYMLDEDEFLSPFGIRSLSRYHHEHPYILNLDDQEYKVQYDPGESTSNMFGGNSNWRGPVWLPLNYLLIEALEQYNVFFGDTLQVECPTGSGKMMNLGDVAHEIGKRLLRLFQNDPNGWAPWHGDVKLFAEDPHWRDYLLFHEYFHGDTGRGCGASHQTGWTALIARLCEHLARRR